MATITFEQFKLIQQSNPDLMLVGYDPNYDPNDDPNNEGAEFRIPISAIPTGGSPEYSKNGNDWHYPPQTDDVYIRFVVGSDTGPAILMESVPGIRELNGVTADAAGKAIVDAKDTPYDKSEGTEDSGAEIGTSIKLTEEQYNEIKETGKTEVNGIPFYRQYRIKWKSQNNAYPADIDIDVIAILDEFGQFQPPTGIYQPVWKFDAIIDGASYNGSLGIDLGNFWSLKLEIQNQTIYQALAIPNTTQSPIGIWEYKAATWDYYVEITGINGERTTVWQEVEEGKKKKAGHVIVDADGNKMTQRGNLQFNGATIEDDEENDTTIVKTESGVGHSIIDMSDNELPQQAKLKFEGNEIVDDPETGETIVKPQDSNVTPYMKKNQISDFIATAGSPIIQSQQQYEDMIASPTGYIEIDGEKFFAGYQFSPAEGIKFNLSAMYYGAIPAELSSMTAEGYVFPANQVYWSAVINPEDIGGTEEDDIDSVQLFLFATKTDAAIADYGWELAIIFESQGQFMIQTMQMANVAITKSPAFSMEGMQFFYGLGAEQITAKEAFDELYNAFEENNTELTSKVLTFGSAMEFSKESVDIENAKFGGYQIYNIDFDCRNIAPRVKIGTFENVGAVDTTITLALTASKIDDGVNVSIKYPQGNIFILPASKYAEINCLIQKTENNYFEITIIYTVYE
jgi:hypothetical protein